MVFKYFSTADYNLDALNSGYFWFSRKKLLDDKNDLCFKLIKDTLFYKNLKENHLPNDEIEEYVDKLSVCCFSKRIDNDVMWKKYADNGRGFALIIDDSQFFRFNEIDIGVRFSYYPVTYIEDFGVFNDENGKYSVSSQNISMCEDINFEFKDVITESRNNLRIDRIFNYLLTVKHNEYSCEEERRLLLGLDVFKKTILTNIKIVGDGGFKVMIPTGIVKGIVICPNISRILFKRLECISYKMQIPLCEFRKELVILNNYQ